MYDAGFNPRLEKTNKQNPYSEVYNLVKKHITMRNN